MDNIHQFPNILELLRKKMSDGTASSDEMAQYTYTQMTDMYMDLLEQGLNASEAKKTIIISAAIDASSEALDSGNAKAAIFFAALPILFAPESFS